MDDKCLRIWQSRLESIRRLLFDLLYEFPPRILQHTAVYYLDGTPFDVVIIDPKMAPTPDNLNPTEIKIFLRVSCILVLDGHQASLYVGYDLKAATDAAETSDQL